METFVFSYNPLITTHNSKVLKPNKICKIYNIFKLKDLNFKPCLGHKKKTCSEIKRIQEFVPEDEL